jgi:hypothetical protein
MRKRQQGFMLAALLASAAGVLARDQTAQAPQLPLSEAVVARLPVEWREPSIAHVKATAIEQQRFLAIPDAQLRQVLVRLLARVPALDAFVKAQLAKDPSPAVRGTIVQAMASDARWAALPDTTVLIERVVATDPDSAVSMAALEALRRARMRALNTLLNERVAREKASGASASLERLAHEQERWTNLERGVMLPSFFQNPPPLFSLKPADQAVRVLAFGDFGTGSPAQKAVGATLVRYDAAQPFDFGITVGDNFYSAGMLSPSDERWQTQWEEIYGPLGITFYPTLGNHDWGHPDSPAAEILYSQKTSTWRMPAAYYTFTAGPIQFFAIDTQSIAGSEKQLAWLDRELSRSEARWKIVYGHHVIYSGGAYQDSAPLVARLLPVLRNRADAYICGHDHNLQALSPDAGVRFYVAGGGGAGLYELRPYERTVFASRSNGFAVLEADHARLTVKLVDVEGELLYEDTIRKEATSPVPPR